jgi:hypothetical protein
LLQTAVDPGGTIIVVFLAGGAGLLLLMQPAKVINAGAIKSIFRNFIPPIFASTPLHIREGPTRLEPKAAPLDLQARDPSACGSNHPLLRDQRDVTDHFIANTWSGKFTLG